MLKVGLTDLKVVLDASCFIFEQVAYYNIGGDSLHTQLQQAGLDDAHVRFRPL